MTKIMRAIAAFLGLFMLMPGTVKFFDPFKTFFTVQITESQLPFPTLAYWTGQLGEIAVGAVLFALAFFWKKFPVSMALKAFYLSHLVVTVILLVSLYVHAHPNVPAHVLPMEQKFPFLTVLMLFLIGLNLKHYRRCPPTTDIKLPIE